MLAASLDITTILASDLQKFDGAKLQRPREKSSLKMANFTFLKETEPALTETFATIGVLFGT